LPLLSNDAIKDVVLTRLREIRVDPDFRLYAWVIMPEHMHALVRPSGGGNDISAFLSRLKRPTARRILARWTELDAPILTRLVGARGRRRFWQPGGGYDRSVLSRGELIEKARYIEDNPVRRGLIGTKTDYRWSSAYWRIRAGASSDLVDTLA